MKTEQCMSGFNLSKNFIDNPKSLLRKSRYCAASSSATPPKNEPLTPTPSATPAMARSLHDYSVLAVDNVLVGLAVNTGAATSS
jgi:hypothetical protein